LHCEKTKKTFKRKEIYFVMVSNAPKRIQVLNSRNKLKRKEIQIEENVLPPSLWSFVMEKPHPTNG
jgi:hypothetical protein